ncbi:MAG TPA: transcription antitermination factor NusB [Porphyromonadaceae bacterium]|uniref:transcription antitermination factor NusB n=1 Tax=Limibacterium fermenti TaxID=3229863 RepID=UPI000E82F55E|nr:transcription antitermination factor NusB [Porphyromonadaceae bacterium]HBK32991.1 transcription antitermination factor NusB [Porphyromonadaceae bacterium]HBL34279.1 transcription antitermination factor NusB [Porphyromonadaceae bacterium]HBX20856.1 transcription antitermination factor NusB [Porphyromonadaceae bacterium]HBX47066.1 transcription antitermination factor NusB [Porphyromonadaceae bacterium]
MINRNLIRIRIVQIIYSWYQNTNKDLLKAEKNLLFALQKSYDLYYYLLLLMVELTLLYENRVETKRNKFLPSEEDLNPNTHLINNKFISQLRDNQQFNDYLGERPMSWNEHDVFVKNMLDDILASDTYQKYAALDHPDYDDDKEFWRKVFKQFIYMNEALDDLLEDECIYWNDGIDIIQTFVLKTIKKFSEENGSKQSLLPMFKDEGDKKYALELLNDAIHNEDKYRALIQKTTDKWDFDRIAFMDMIIMQVALAEIFTFESIPASVSLNEYIEIAKFYSTPKSSTFINGILDAVVKEIRTENSIVKI